MHRRHMTGRATRRLLLAGGAALALTLAPAQAGLAATNDGTVLICEATGNPSAPYVEIRVAQSDLSQYGSAQGDIIPAPAGGCPASVSGAAAPVETGSTTAAATTTASTATASTTSATSTSVTHTHHTSPPRSGGGVKGSSGTTVGTLPSAPRLTSTNPLATQTAPMSTLHELPRTGGEVPLTLLIAGSMLLAAAAIPLARRIRGRA